MHFKLNRHQFMQFSPLNNERKYQCKHHFSNDFAYWTQFLHVCNNLLQTLLRSLKDVWHFCRISRRTLLCLYRMFSKIVAFLSENAVCCFARLNFALHYYSMVLKRVPFYWHIHWNMCFTFEGVDFCLQRVQHYCKEM